MASAARIPATAVLAFVILLCYGGGFGTMPSFATDYFGAKDIGSIYGLMLTAWRAGAVAGPTFVALVRQATGGYQAALNIMSLLTLAEHDRSPHSAAAGFAAEAAGERERPGWRQAAGRFLTASGFG